MRYKYIIQRLQRFVSFISFDTIRSYTFESCKSSYRRESIVKFLYSVSKTFHIPCLSFNVAKIRNVLRIFFSYRKLYLLLPASIPTITILSPHFQISLRIRERVSLDLWKGRRKLIAGPFPSPAPSYALVNLTGDTTLHATCLRWIDRIKGIKIKNDRVIFLHRVTRDEARRGRGGEFLAMACIFNPYSSPISILPNLSESLAFARVGSSDQRKSVGRPPPKRARNTLASRFRESTPLASPRFRG